MAGRQAEGKEGRKTHLKSPVVYGRTFRIKQQYNRTKTNMLLDCNNQTLESRQREGKIQYHSSETTSAALSSILSCHTIKLIKKVTSGMVI